MKHPSKPLVIKLKAVRENPPDGPHGLVHQVLNVKWAQKRTVTLCGLSSVGMRNLGSDRGFPGVEDVECPDCNAALEL